MGPLNLYLIGFDIFCNHFVVFYRFVRTFHTDGHTMTDTYWHHVCIMWFSSDGNWTFYTDGVKKVEGTGLAANFNTVLGYLIIGKFKGSLTFFSIWDEFIKDASRIEQIMHPCSAVTGNIVLWSDVQLWRVGNVGKSNGSLCKFAGEKFRSLNLV